LNAGLFEVNGGVGVFIICDPCDDLWLEFNDKEVVRFYQRFQSGLFLTDSAIVLFEQDLEI
jgi:hypothetical protein